MFVKTYWRITNVPVTISMLGWAGTACVLAGRWLFVVDTPDLGFLVSVLGDFLWLAYGVKARIWSLAFLDLVLLTTDIVGVITHPFAF